MDYLNGVFVNVNVHPSIPPDPSCCPESLRILMNALSSDSRDRAASVPAG